MPVDLWVVNLDEKLLVQHGQLRLLEFFRGSFAASYDLFFIRTCLSSSGMALSGLVRSSTSGLVLKPWETKSSDGTHVNVNYENWDLAREVGADPNARFYFHEKSPFNTKAGLFDEVLLLLAAAYTFTWTQKLWHVSELQHEGPADQSFLNKLVWDSNDKPDREFNLVKHQSESMPTSRAMACKILPNCGSIGNNGLVLGVKPQWGENQAEVAQFLLAWFMRRVKDAVNANKRQLENGIFGAKP